MMDNIREKLVELLCGIQDYGEKTKHLNGSYAFVERNDNRTIADHLVANGVTVQEWIPVTERLPDETKDEYVLVVCDYYGKIEVETRKMWHIDSVVTHWQPLPHPPKGE